MNKNKVIFFNFRRPTIAVLRLQGVIGALGGISRGLSLQTVEQRLDAAFKVRNLQAVAVAVNSPGGAPVQSDLIANRLRVLADEHKIPIFTFIEDVGASGGYWLACAGDEIYARSNSIVGSIGVVSGGFGLTEIMKKVGIERRVYTSGEKKAMNDPFQPEKPAEVKHLKALQKNIHDDFISMVKSRRGRKLKSTDRILFSGAYWTGRQAVQLGLIDAIGDLRSIMLEKFSEKARFKVFGENRSWLQRRFQVGYMPGSGTGRGNSLGEDLVSSIEERLWWSRFGL